MQEPPIPDVDVDAILAELRATHASRGSAPIPSGGVAQRRGAASSVELRASTARGEISTEQLMELIAELERRAAAVGGHPSTGSRLPGGAQLHAASSRLIERHTNHLAGEVREVAGVVIRALDELRRLTEAQRLADERQMAELVAAVEDRAGVLPDLVQAAAALEARLAKLEAGGEQA